jgi:hypothetical protein
VNAASWIAQLCLPEAVADYPETHVRAVLAYLGHGETDKGERVPPSPLRERFGCSVPVVLQ